MDSEHRSDNNDEAQYSSYSNDQNIGPVARIESVRSRSVPDINRDVYGLTGPTMVGSSSSSSSVYFSAHGDSQTALGEPTERPNGSCTVYYSRSLGHFKTRNDQNGDDREKPSAEVLFFSPLELKHHVDSLGTSRSKRPASSSEISFSESPLNDVEPIRCLDGAEDDFIVPFVRPLAATDSRTEPILHQDVSTCVSNVSKVSELSDCVPSKNSGSSDSEVNTGLPEIYLVPSIIVHCNSFDGVLNFASDKEDNLSDQNNEEAVVSLDHDSGSDDTAESSLVLASMDAAYFRDKPRGEPMGSESGGGGGQLLAVAPPLPSASPFSIGNVSETSDDDENVAESVGFQTLAVDKWSSWVRGDVEGADNVEDRLMNIVTLVNNPPPPPPPPPPPVPVFINLSLNIDDEIMNSQGSVRPPLVGQSEENHDVAPVLGLDYKQKTNFTPPQRSLSEEELESQASVSLSSESKDSLAVRVSNLLNSSIQSAVSPTVSDGNSVVECEPSTDTGGSKIDIPIEISIPRPTVRRRDYYISVDDDLFKQNSSRESTDTEQPPIVSGYQSDQRASSPSVVSVSSMASSRRLEWDSGADIGYGGPKVLYGLSTLERMAIGTFLQRTEPEGKSALGKDRPTRQGVTIVTSQLKPKDGAESSVASLEDVVVSVLDGNNLPSTIVGTDDEDRRRSNLFPDSEDTDCELVLCYKKQLCKESESSNSESQPRRSNKESCQQRKKLRRPHSGGVRALNIGANVQTGTAKTFVVNSKGQRSSSLTDLSHVTRLNVRDAQPHSNSVSDVRGLNVTEVKKRSVSSSASMLSSSSSSTVVGAPFETKHAPVSSTPFCSTVINDSPNSLPLKPSFNTPVGIGIISAHEVPSCEHDDPNDIKVSSETKREEDFNQLLAVTGRLFRNLCPAPTISERQKLLRAFLEVVTNDPNGNLQPVQSNSSSSQKNADQFANKSTFVVQVPVVVGEVSLSPKRKSSSRSNSKSVTHVAIGNDGCSVPKVSFTSLSYEGECVPVPSTVPVIQQQLCNDSEIHLTTVAHQAEEAATGYVSVQCEENHRGRSLSPSFRSAATKDRDCQPRFSAATLAPRTTALSGRFCSASTSGGSESTMDTIRERKQQYADDTLASSFEYYGVPSTKGLKHFRAPPSTCFKGAAAAAEDGTRDGYLWKMLRRSRAAQSSATSSRSSNRLRTTITTSSEDIRTSSSASNDRRLSRVTVKNVSYVTQSLPTSDVHLDSSTPSPAETAHCSRRFLDRLQVMGNLNHEGLCVVKELVCRQRNSYIRKLKREVDWLERVEAILIGGEAKPHNYSTTFNRKNPPLKPKPARVPTDRYPQPNPTKLPPAREPPIRVISRRMRDFGQCFPTPQISEDEIHDSVECKRLSVGVQTSDSLLDNNSNVFIQKKTSRYDRPIVNIPLTVAKRSPKQNSVPMRRERITSHPHKNGSSSSKRALCNSSRTQCSVTWFYPLGDGQPRHLISNGPSVTFRRGPADGAQADQLGITGANPNSRAGATQEPLTLQEAFKLLKSDFIHNSTARQQKLKARQKSTGMKKLTSLKRAYVGKHTKPLPMSSQHHNPQPRNLSHRQMRDQTEKLYEVLSEVAERQELRKRQDMYRTNRLMAQMFKKKLQEKVLQGKVSMSNTQKCM